MSQTLTRTYQRSQILSFYELNEVQQLTATDQLDERAQTDKYVLFNDEPLPLSMFLRTKGGQFGGVYSIGTFSAYFIKINKTGEEATVCYSHC